MYNSKQTKKKVGELLNGRLQNNILQWSSFEIQKQSGKTPKIKEN